jgi:gliding motility-associated-like protein
MEIYNRWGQKVFEATDGNYFWDGTQNDEPAAADVYVWVVRYTCGGDDETRHGEVTLLR